MLLETSGMEFHAVHLQALTHYVKVIYSGMELNAPALLELESRHVSTNIIISLQAKVVSSKCESYDLFPKQILFILFNY